MKKILVLLASIFISTANAQIAPFEYKLGAVQVSEAEDSLTIRAATTLNARILPGGHIWPRVTLSDDGNIYVGNMVISAANGVVVRQGSTSGYAAQALPFGVDVTVNETQIRVERGTRTCTFSRHELGLRDWKPANDAFRDENIKFAASKGQLLALVAQLEEDSNADTYVINDINLERCHITPTRIGNPDLLVELDRSSDGGWWLTGSIEPTLLRSADGKRWRKTPLPKGISSLISSYAVNDREIWLAGVLPAADDDDPLIIHTSDGGKHWQNVPRRDPLLARLPKAWLEGKRRVAMPVAR